MATQRQTHQATTRRRSRRRDTTTARAKSEIVLAMVDALADILRWERTRAA